MKDSLSRYLVLLVIALLASGLLLPRLYDMPYPYPLSAPSKFKPSVKKNFLEALTEKQPEFVLLGDSVMHDGVDQAALSQMLGAEAYNIGIPGSGSAVWYLIFKNIVINAPVPPRSVVVLFRDTILTIPSFRTTGHYFEGLDDYARAKEPLLVELAFVDPMSPAEKLAQQYLPLYSARWRLREAIDSALRYTAAATLGCSTRCVDDAMDSAFGKQALDAIAMQQSIYDGGTLYAPENMNFEKRVDNSFLPAMIHIAQSNNIELIFIRMKNMAYPQIEMEMPELRAYHRALESYLSTQDGVHYINLAHDERILDSYFIDQVHLSETGRVMFTQILANELKPFAAQEKKH
ncbi:MAG: hypothetical protein Fur002_20770 [Anaerolineales bacterium]